MQARDSRGDQLRVAIGVGHRKQVEGVGAHQAAAAEVRLGHHFSKALASLGRPPELGPEPVQFIVNGSGVEHVGLGGDYDGTEQLPLGLEDVTGYPRLLGALADRGWSDDDLARLTSGNILRVMQDAQDGAVALQQQRGPSLATIDELDGQSSGDQEPAVSSASGGS